MDTRHRLVETYKFYIRDMRKLQGEPDTSISSPSKIYIPHCGYLSEVIEFRLYFVKSFDLILQNVSMFCQLYLNKITNSIHAMHENVVFIENETRTILDCYGMFAK